MLSNNSVQLRDKLNFLQVIVTCYIFGETFVARKCKTACWTKHCLLKSFITSRVEGQKFVTYYSVCIHHQFSPHQYLLLVLRCYFTGPVYYDVS